MKTFKIGLREVRRKEESFTTLQSGHMLYHSEANNGQAGGGFLVNKTWKDNITRVSSGNSRVAELVLRITDISQLVTWRENLDWFTGQIERTISEYITT